MHTAQARPACTVTNFQLVFVLFSYMLYIVHCSGPVAVQQQSVPDTTTGTRTDRDGGGEGDQSMVELDEAMKEIQASIDEFTEQPTAEGSDDESDSEDEEEEGGRSFRHV